MAFNSSMPMFWGDYDRDTGHLCAAEHGAYLMLIKHQWCTCRPLPDDDALLARIAKMTPREWRSARKVLVDFFEVGGGAWTHKRVVAELEKAKARFNQAVNAGRASAERRRQQKGNGGSTPVATDGQRPLEHELPPRTNQPKPEPEPEPREDGGGDGSARANVQRETPDLGHVVGDAVLGIIGVTNDPRWLGNYSLVRAWLNAGADPELDIYPTIRAVMAQRNGQGPPGTLKYFTKAIARAHAERTTDPFDTGEFTRGNHDNRTGKKHRNGFAQLIAESEGETGDPDGLAGPPGVGHADML